MSSTVLRLGLWIVIVVLAAYVIHESLEEQPVAEMIPVAMLGKALTLGGILVVAGIVLRMFEKGSKAVAKNRCAICRTTIPKGAIYCREHLRNVLAAEDERTHMTKIRKR
jgi:predicted nucleic acid-binding Zn ribbon protein